MDTDDQRHNHPTGGQDHSSVALSPIQRVLLEELGDEQGDLLWERKDGSVEWSPLIQARIAERIAFDGDLPELRTGNLPEGGRPAVPIYADGTCAVRLGLGLLKASKEVQTELDSEKEKWIASLEGVSPEALQVLSQEVVFHVPGYTPGHPAVMRDVTVTFEEVVSLSPTERQKIAFTALSTTQGRASALPLIQGFLVDQITAAGHQVRLVPRRTAPPIARGSWTVLLDGGPGEWSSGYSPIDLARTVLWAQLRHLLGRKPRNLALSVGCVGKIHERVVGWEAHLYGD